MEQDGHTLRSAAASYAGNAQTAYCAVADAFVEAMDDDKPFCARDVKQLRRIERGLSAQHPAPGVDPELLVYARGLQVADVLMAETALAGHVRRLNTLERLFLSPAGPELDADASDEGEDGDKGGKTSAGTELADDVDGTGCGTDEADEALLPDDETHAGSDDEFLEGETSSGAKLDGEDPGSDQSDAEQRPSLHQD
eukprot:m51a1_g4812 hypothetical protein (197) ;mRNA; r:136113-136703